MVLYFYPKAFTQGCTLEAHAFAEATPEFAKAGATVIGMSNDDLPRSRSSRPKRAATSSRSPPPVPAIVKAYDVDLVRDGKSTGLTKRTSYVIDRRTAGSRSSTPTSTTSDHVADARRR